MAVSNDTRSPESSYCSRSNIALPAERYSAAAQVTGVNGLEERAAEHADLLQFGGALTGSGPSSADWGALGTVTRSNKVNTETYLAPKRV